MPFPAPIAGAPPYGRYLEIIEKRLFTEGPSGGSETIPLVNVYHYFAAGGALAQSPLKSAVNTGFLAALGNLVAAAISVRAVGVERTVRFIDDITDPPIVVGVPATGAITGDCLPPTTAAYIKLLTGWKGQGGRGSKHYGPIAEQDTVSTEIITPTPAYWTALVAGMWAQMTVVINGVNVLYNHAVLSPTRSNLVIDPPQIAMLGVNNATLRRNLGIMKKRRVKFSTAA